MWASNKQNAQKAGDFSYSKSKVCITGNLESFYPV